jgi:hypothetical protein
MKPTYKFSLVEYPEELLKHFSTLSNSIVIYGRKPLGMIEVGLARFIDNKWAVTMCDYGFTKIQLQRQLDKAIKENRITKI